MHKTALHPYRRPILFALAILCCAGLLAAFAARLGERTRAEQKEILRAAVTRAAVTCYAIEGRYPANLQYLIDNYGVSVEGGHFIVSYEAFADNIMPDIRVLEKGGAQ